MKKNGMIC